MTEVLRITIDHFCFHIKRQYGKYNLQKSMFDFDYAMVKVTDLAREFIKFFEIEPPFSIVHLRIICANSDIMIKNIPDCHKTRGYYFAYGEDIQIFIKKNDSPSSKIHTILHELYEIINEKLYSYSNNEYKRKKKDIEAKADQFAAYVHAPDKIVIQWIKTKGLDVFGLTDFLTCSYATALIRMNDVLCAFPEIASGEYLPVISILFERPYWEKTDNEQTPGLQLKIYKKSRGFFFRLSQNEINELRFHSKKSSNITISKIVNLYSSSDNDILLMNIQMEFRVSKLTVDMLIRTVNWKNRDSTAKILIQLMPSERKELRELAERLNLKKYDLG